MGYLTEKLKLFGWTSYFTMADVSVLGAADKARSRT